MADTTDELDRLAELVPDDAWLTVPDIVERLDSDVQKVRRMLDERLLVGVRRSSTPGGPKVLQVPARLVEPEPLVSLPGTLTVLFDAGFSDAEALRWLFTPDEALGTSPVEALRANRIAPVRRVAQVLGY
ncbi:Rv2175c family DNA-binding protein [Quadrisphaera sp. INWT6]|uniref:Rv2175c family DNA-binding protein n=1 Tax=Quadrisphaera sp. INWT6 TaxID=2596917 RepID=UPI0019D5CBE5|nr:Rv2175c family DNA-binding protein [Quadrisphaera sp. INWT6]MBF5080804.1 DNA-binding protein [Quadrisphaera sp. INWT6]